MLYDGSAWKRGKDSAFALADNVARPSIDCELRNVDRNGRLVAVCGKGNQHTNAQLVRNGWALTYTD